MDFIHAMKQLCQARIFGVSRKAITTWLKEAIRALPPFQSSVSASQPGDVLELDEVWSFVGNKQQKVWLWLALCRRTRQIVAYTLGDRSTQTCQELYNKLPQSYRHCKTYSDFWVRGGKSATTDGQWILRIFHLESVQSRLS